MRDKYRLRDVNSHPVPMFCVYVCVCVCVCVFSTNYALASEKRVDNAGKMCLYPGCQGDGEIYIQAEFVSTAQHLDFWISIKSLHLCFKALLSSVTCGVFFSFHGSLLSASPSARETTDIQQISCGRGASPGSHV